MNCFQNANFSEDSQVFRLFPVVPVVVNCFQNANFSEDSQVTGTAGDEARCCELLSEC